MSAASSCLPPSTFSSSALTWAICPPSSRLAALSPPPPAAPAWAATWESWPTEKVRRHHQPELCGPHGRHHLEIYLASPAVAAASAVAGFIADPRN